MFATCVAILRAAGGTLATISALKCQTFRVSILEDNVTHAAVLEGILGLANNSTALNFVHFAIFILLIFFIQIFFGDVEV